MTTASGLFNSFGRHATIDVDNFHCSALDARVFFGFADWAALSWHMFKFAITSKITSLRHISTLDTGAATFAAHA